jgi:predicted nucleic acid-binding Zn ribbon protein
MVRLAAYKGTHKGVLGLVNWAIRLVTRSKHSHTEIIIDVPDEDRTFFAVSASGVDGGVRGKTIVMTPDKWDFLPIPWVTEEQVLAWLNQYQGAPYDYFGTTRFLLPFAAREHENAWFCSEACAEIIGIEEPWRFDPATLVMAVRALLKIKVVVD